MCPTFPDNGTKHFSILNKKKKKKKWKSEHRHESIKEIKLEKNYDDGDKNADFRSSA